MARVLRIGAESMFMVNMFIMFVVLRPLQTSVMSECTFGICVSQCHGCCVSMYELLILAFPYNYCKYACMMYESSRILPSSRIVHKSTHVWSGLVAGVFAVDLESDRIKFVLLTHQRIRERTTD